MFQMAYMSIKFEIKILHMSCLPINCSGQRLCHITMLLIEKHNIMQSNVHTAKIFHTCYVCNNDTISLNVNGRLSPFCCINWHLQRRRMSESPFNSSWDYYFVQEISFFKYRFCNVYYWPKAGGGGGFFFFF